MVGVRTMRKAKEIPHANDFAKSYEYFSNRVPIPLYSLQGIEGGLRDAGLPSLPRPVLVPHGSDPPPGPGSVSAYFTP